MGNPDRGVGGIDALAAGPGGTVDVDPQLVGVEVHLHLLGLGDHRHGDGRGMNPPLGLGFRHPLHPVHPGLVLQAAVHLVAADQGDDLLETADADRVAAHHFDAPALGFGITAVHFVEVADKKGRLVAAGPGPDLQEDILLVVGVLGQQRQAHLLLQFRLPGAQLLDLGADQVLHLLVLLALEEFAVFPQTLPGPAEVGIKAMQVGNLGMLPGQLAERLLIWQAAGIGQFLLQLLQLIAEIGKPLKHLSIFHQTIDQFKTWRLGCPSHRPPYAKRQRHIFF